MMTIRGQVLACFLSLPLLSLSGCIETKVEIRLEPDGSGARRVEMVWRQGDLDDVELSVDELRVILDLPAERGWIMREENRPVRDGSLEPHVIFERVAEMGSLTAWQLEGQDLRMQVDTERSARMHDEVYVEVGQGAGYRTLGYTERLDGQEIRALLNRMVARYAAERLTAVWPELGETGKAELRGLLLGHLSHYDVWVLEDDEIDDAWNELVAEISPQIGLLLLEHGYSSQQAHDTHGRFQEMLEEDDVNEWLEEELPGLSLLALMNLKFEITLPGVIVESNADRTGEGYAAWERSAWEAIDEPLEFRVRSRIED